MKPKSSRQGNPKIIRINLLKPHGRCYKWHMSRLNKIMNIFRATYLFLAAASLVVLATPGEARNYYVRETKGTVEIRGWEKPLLKKNPNLKHWSWMPITASYNRVKPIAPSKKPWKVDRVLRKAPVERIVQVPRYMRPVHASMPVGRNNDGSMRQNPRVSNPLVVHDTSGALRSRDVAAKLQMQRTQAQLAARNVDAGLSMPVVKANYRLANHEAAGYLAAKKTDIKLVSNNLNGQLAQKGVAGRLASRSADGRLLSQNVDGALESKTVSADLITPIERRYEFDYRGPAGGFDDVPTFASGMMSSSGRVSAKIKRNRCNKF